MPDLGSMLPDRKVEYKKAKQSGEDLEIPPDLTRSSADDALVVPDINPTATASYSDYAGERRGPATVSGQSAVLPKMDNVAVERDRDQRWLLVQAPVEDVWFKVVSFWQENGILLMEQDPSVGVMRTAWIENRADIKSDFLTNAIRSLFDSAYSAATRDQYRVRLEEGGAPGTTEVYLTHRGMEEDLVTDVAGNTKGSMWRIRETDHGLEAEMLRRLMVYFGVEERKAESALARESSSKPRSRLTDAGGQAMLSIDDGFSRAWRLTGMALDRVGFAVEDRDRGKGLYYVRYDDPMKDDDAEEGFFSKLAFWRDDEAVDKENQYQVSLRAEGETTQVVVLDKEGNRDNSGTAVRILTLLHEQIR